ncbi:MAG: serine hydrolase domain-containing protein [Nocardioidaceae bacterium]
MEVHGSHAPRFRPVAEAFADVVAGQTGTGAALAVWHDGEWVLDLWGGWADAAHTRPWARDSLVMPYSVTKAFAAVCGLLVVERGLVGLDSPLQEVWPELTAPTTLRQVLAHQSGLSWLDAPAPEEAFYDWDLMCALLAAQPPAWEPGSAHGESALFFGHLVGEVVRRVDGRGLGAFLREEVCAPLGLDFHVGLREGELARTVDLTGFGEEFRRRGEGMPDMLRALANPPGARDPRVVNGERWRRAEIPAVNGHGTARAVAGLFVALHEGRLLAPETVTAMTTVTAAGPDRVLGADARWGLGVAVEDDGWGMGGVGGSLGWWSDEGGYAFGFVTGEIAGHDRSGRLENAVRACLGLAPL